MAPIASLHLGRSVGIAGCATLVSVLTHAIASTEMPGPIELVIPFLLSFLACAALVGARLTTTRIVAATGISQLIFHVSSLVGPHDAAASSAEHALPHPLSVGHAMTAALTILVILAGRRTLGQVRVLAGLLFGWLAAVLETTAVPSYPVAPRPRATARAAMATILVDVISRRGPPIEFATS